MDVFENIFNWLIDRLNEILSWVAQVLPPSPFKLLSMTPLKPYLPYINYFLPMDFVLSAFSAWSLAISTYYLYQVILRWAKAIK